MSARLLPVAAAVLGMAISGVAPAQEDAGDGAEVGQTAMPGGREIAEECLSELREIDAEMMETGYVPPAGSGYGGAPMAPAYPVTYSPRTQLLILRDAARILAFNDNAEGCRIVVAEMREVHDTYMEMLEEDAVDAPTAGQWRIDRLALAESVTAVDVTWRTDEVVGTDVRNVDGNWLGEVDDLVLDDEGITFALLARDGFLGIGQEVVPVPWDMLSVTPDLLTFVVDVPEGVVEDAPAFESAAMLEAAEEDWRQTVRTYWEEHAGG